MNRKHFIAIAATSIVAAAFSREVKGAVRAIKPPVIPAGRDIRQSPVFADGAAQIPTSRESRLTAAVGADIAPICGVLPLPKLSGYTEKSLVCQCPACNGSGFRGEDRDECGYCHMNGILTTTERFAMYNDEGNAEVWRALVWHEWSQRNWKESDGPKPWLPGMLCHIGEQHPEVYDTAVRDRIFAWLENRFDKAHAQVQYDAWVAEVECQNREHEKYKAIYARHEMEGR